MGAFVGRRLTTWSPSTPYSCLAFEIRTDGTAATDVEHIVAVAEAHHSRIADDRRRDIASDLDAGRSPVGAEPRW